jgi:hypothetical protein
MSASPIARQATQCQTIPSRRVVINDASQLPVDYSTTPGGTVYSTTPGGKSSLFSCVLIYLADFLYNTLLPSVYRYKIIAFYYTNLTD